MKKILLIILFTSQVFATDWHVKNGGSGNNNGSNWTNAWTSFANINWTSIQPGDALYIDGGVDSVVYNAQLTPGKSGTRLNFIRIFAGKYSSSPSGHSGRVIIKGTGTRSIYIQNKNYLWLKGFELTGSTSGFEIEDGAKYVICDSMNIYGYTGQAGVRANTNTRPNIDSCVVRFCRIESPQLSSGQTDGMYFQRCTRMLIHDNWVHQRNQDELAHTDCIQGNNNAGAVAYNNFCINDSVNSSEGGGTPMIFGFDAASPQNYNIMVANNFLYVGGMWDATASQNSVWWSRSYENQTTVKCWLINNTIVSNGPRTRGVIYEYQTYASNNIIAMYNGPTMVNMEESLPNSIYVDSTRNNLFYRAGGNPTFAGSFTGNGNTGTNVNSTNWFSTYGGTGQMVNPLLEINVGHEPDQRLLRPDLLSNSPAIDAGNNIFNGKSYMDWVSNQGFNGTNPHQNETIATGVYGGVVKWRLPSDRDINNNPRGSIPDVGSFEYQSGTPAPVDSIPNAFSFTDVTNAHRDSLHTSNLVTFTGFDSAYAYAGGYEFQINSGAWRTARIKVFNNDNGKVRRYSSTNYSIPVNTTLTVGSTSDTYTVTTGSAPAPVTGAKVLIGKDGKLIPDKNGKLIMVNQ